MDLVSIVLPTLNGEKYLHEALNSILAQTYDPLDCIIVDGGSKDGTLEILARYNDPRLRVVHQPANTGKLPGALNLGFDHSHGTYLTWMQDDDIYEPTAIETMVRALQANPGVDFIYSDYWWIDQNSNRLRKEVVPPPEELYRRNCIGHYFMYRRSVIEAVGKYDPNYFMAEDYEYWLRIYKKRKMLPIHEPQYLYRAHPGSLTFRNYGKYQALRVVARASHRWLETSRWEYQRAVAQAYIEEAFESYSKSDLPHCRSAVLRGILHDPSWLGNKGVVSILAQSVLGIRRHRPAANSKVDE